MRPENSPPSLQLLTFIISSIFLAGLPGIHSQDHPQLYSDCQSSFECGNLKEISYPFRGNGQSHCGRQGFELQCHPNQYPVINMENQSFIVLEIDQNSQWMKLARSDIWDGACPLLNTALNHSPFCFNATGIRNLTILHGSLTKSFNAENAYNFSCNTKNGSIDYDYLACESLTDSENLCDLQIRVPVHVTAYDQLVNGTLTPKEALSEGFLADYHFDEEEFCKACKTSRGTCVPKGINSTQVHCKIG